MAANDFGFSSAMATFDNAYNQKANRKLTQEKTTTLANENQRTAIQGVSNTVLGQDAFGVKDGGLIADVPKFMNLSKSAQESFLNAGNNVRKYYDEKGDVVTGYLLAPEVLTDDGSGVKRYAFKIRTKDGEEKAVTVGRSGDESEAPAFIDKNALATLLEGQLANTLTQGGISGYAYGKLKGLNMESTRGKTHALVAKGLADENLLPEELMQLIEGGNESLAGLREEGEIADAEGGTSLSQITAKKAVNTGADGSELPGARQMAVEEDMSRKPITNMQEFVKNSPFESDPLKKALTATGRSADIIQAKRLITDDLLEQLGYYDSKTEDGSVGPAVYAIRKNKAKAKFIDDFQAELKSSEQPEVPTDGVKDVTTVPSNIPTDEKGIREWFDNENNVAALQKISPDDVTRVQELLEEKQINSKADLVKAANDRVLNDTEYRQVAALIAFSYNGGTSVADSRALYSDLVNELETGNPNVTSDDVRNTNIKSDKLRFEIEKYGNENATAFSTNLSELYDAGVTGKEGEKESDYSTGNPEFIAKLKGTLPKFLGLVRSGKATTEQLELMDGVIAEAISDEIGSGSEGIVDLIGDILFRGNRVETLGSSFDNFEIIYGNAKKADGQPKPIRIQFTNTVGSSQLPSEQSMDWEEFTAKIGQGELANYVEQRAKKR
jgi:hypothetical protein